MNKYSEIEIQIANSLLRDGYKWLVRTMRGNVVAFSCKPCKNEGYWVWPSYAESEVVSGKSAPLFQNIQWEDSGPTYIEDIVNPQILDEAERQYLSVAERQYLSVVIRPFRDKVRSITKNPKMNGKGEYIVIDIGFQLENRHKFFMFFPDFKSNTMYKGMELGKEYTLEELGL